MPVGQTQQFNATVYNDPSGSGVTWRMTGCAGGASACGNIVDSSIAVASFAAPNMLPPAGQSVTITATSITDNTKFASAVVTFVNGSIRFSSGANVEAGSAPVGVAVADFDGDGKLDLAVADNGDPRRRRSRRGKYLTRTGRWDIRGRRKISCWSKPEFDCSGRFQP